jgi:hypothetical protein
MAVSRRDMLEILDHQDSIADSAQDIAELAEIRSMTIPEPMREPMRELVRRVIAACEQGERVVNRLDELVETGFSEREVARDEEMIGAVNREESETDALAERCLRTLFAIEDELGEHALLVQDHPMDRRPRRPRRAGGEPAPRADRHLSGRPSCAATPQGRSADMAAVIPRSARERLGSPRTRSEEFPWHSSTSRWASPSRNARSPTPSTSSPRR